MNLFEALFIPNIIVFILACIAVSVKYEQYEKFHYAVVAPVSCILGRFVYSVGISIVDKFYETSTCIHRSLNGRTGIRQPYNKLDRVGLGSKSEFHNPFFSRPKPVIADLPLHGRECSPLDNIVINGKQLNLHGCRATELYVNIVNEGKTSIKRMRVRAKIHELQGIGDRPPIERPPGLNDEDWQRMKNHDELWQRQTKHMIDRNLFGRTLPFTRTPSGTVAYPLIQADGSSAFQVDLAPKNDEASVQLVAIYPLDRIARSQIVNAGLTIDDSGSLYPIIAHIGYVEVKARYDPNRSPTALFGEYLIKFWIIAENITNDITEIFHIEIPETLDDIVCRKVRKHSLEYWKFDKLLKS